MTTNVLKKQNGYTLIWVLLIVVLIGILTPLIASKVISSKLQVQKTEQSMQLEKVRQMGVAYMESVIKHANEELADESDSLLDSKQYNEKLQQKMIQINHDFNSEVVKTLKQNGPRFSLEINPSEIEEDKVIISYTVTYSLNNSIPPKESTEEVTIDILNE